jgi:hypothetical protein
VDVGLLNARRALAALLPIALLATGAASEAELKSAFVFRIARFVDWPEEHTAPGVLRVAVLGDDPLTHTVEAMIDGETVHQSRIEVRRTGTPEEATPCDILVVSGYPAPVEEILAAMGDAPVLTIGDAPDFARRGGSIGLVRDGSRIALEINRGALDARRLRVSSQLLRLATIVETGGP